MIELMALVILLGLVLLLRRLVFSDTNLAGAVGFLFTGPRPDGWPIGVQEEDRDRPWGRATKPSERPGGSDPPSRSPTLVRVKPSVNAR
jgi:hypothetical protein